MRHRVRPVVLLCAVAGTVALAACGAKTNSSSSSSGASTAAKGGKQGGSMTVVLNSGYDGAWPAGLDPVTNTNGAANQSLMNSIYGQLIELHEGGKLVPGLASAFKFSNGGKTFTLTIRPGVKFSDGTPFTAQVVADHINKVLKSPCTCRPTWPVKSVTASGNDVVINFTTVYAPAAASFIDSNANWVPSPTAEARSWASASSGSRPVGAGPFTVVSDKLSSQIVLKRNPTYFKQDRPFLDQLTFKSIGGDEAAYQALQAGQAQAYENLSTPSLIDQMKKDPKLQVTQQLSTSPYNIQLNTNAPPFNNPKARQAIYYATELRGDPLQAVPEPLPEHAGLHRPRRPLLLGRRARLPHLRPREGQGAGQGARRAEDPAGHDQRARGQADHAGAAEPVGAGGDQDRRSSPTTSGR